MHGYRPQLDSLRALAVTAVLYCHFWMSDTPFAELGVRLFFVLSGFLLTGILLRESCEAHKRSIPQRQVLADFYIRRILRIWPAYYFVLIVAVLFGATAVERTFAWHALFATNVLLFLRGDWYPLTTVHLWTLAVEEQFYLVLPLVVLFWPRRWLKALLVGSIATAVVFRGLVSVFKGGEFYGVLPIAQLDALGAGGLLALLQYQKVRIGWAKLLAWSLPLAILADVFATFSAVHFTFVAALYVVPMAAVVAGAHAGIGGWPGRLLSSPPIVALGRISYGVYLYHIFVAAAADQLLRASGAEPLAAGPLRFALLSAITVGAAAASWFVLERPALALRRHFRRATHGQTLIPAQPTRA